MVKHIPLIILASTIFLVAGCSSSSEIEEQVERPVEELYNDALNTALAGNAKKAAPQFEEVEFPLDEEIPDDDEDNEDMF